MSSDDIKVAIINSALAKFTQARITTLSEDTQERINSTTVFDVVRDRLLIDYDWNFAIKRKTLTPPAEMTPSSITYSGTTATVTLSAGNMTTLSSIGHGAVTTLHIYVSGASPDDYNGTFQITGSTGNTFTYEMDENPGANASGTIVVYPVPGFEFDFLFVLPTTCLRVTEMYDPAEINYTVEDGNIYCDEDEKIQIKYVQQVTDYTLWPPSAKNCLSILLAIEILPSIRGVADVNTRIRLLEEFDKEVLRAYVLNAIEGKPNIPKDMQSLDKGNSSWQTEK